MIEICGGSGKVNIIDALIKTYDIPNGFEMYVDDKIKLNITKINDYGDVYDIQLPKNIDEAQEDFGNFKNRVAWLIFYAGIIDENQKETLSVVLKTLERNKCIKQGVLVYDRE